MGQENKYGFAFPVVAIHKYGITCARSVKDITICTKKGLRNGFYKNLIIIDSNCCRFVIGNARKIAYAPFNFKWWIFLNFQIIVSLDVIKSEVTSFGTLKSEVLTSIKKHRQFFESGGNFREICEYISNATNIQQITTYLCDIYYKRY